MTETYNKNKFTFGSPIHAKPSGTNDGLAHHLFSKLTSLAHLHATGAKVEADMLIDVEVLSWALRRSPDAKMQVCDMVHDRQDASINEFLTALQRDDFELAGLIPPQASTAAPAA